MQFTFVSYFANGLKDTTTRADDVPTSLFNHPGDYLEVTREDQSSGTLRFVDRDSFESWWDDMARAGTWLGVRKTTEKVNIEETISTMKEQPKLQVTKNASLPNVHLTTQQMATNLSKLSGALKEAASGFRNSPEQEQTEAEDHINPSHYQAYVADEAVELQWLETMCRMQRYREHPERFLGALELQVRKYMDRSGKKDGELQEYKKALWYLNFMVAYMANGCKPIKVADIPALVK